MMNKNYVPDISVIVLTYNHARFVEQAINSVLNQKTTYSVELVIGDDASTDGTQELIHQMTRGIKMPIKTVFQRKNGGIQKNILSSVEAASGRFLAFLEGDDYWCDSNKLQRQADYLFSNANCVEVASGCRTETLGSVPITSRSAIRPECNYSAEDYARYILPGHSSGIMIRNFFKSITPAEKKILTRYRWMPMDRVSPLLLLSRGTIFCDDHVVCVHRSYVEDGGKNWSSAHAMQHNPNYYYRYLILDGMCRLLKEFDHFVSLEVLMEYKAELYFKSGRAVKRERQKAWMLLQHVLILLTESDKGALVEAAKRYGH